MMPRATSDNSGHIASPSIMPKLASATSFIRKPLGETARNERR